MINISATLIKDYLACTKKVDFRRQDGVYSKQTPDMLAGTIVHMLIENNLEAYDDVLKVVDLDKSGKSKIEICMSNYRDFYQPLTSKEDKIELQFKLPFAKGVNIVGKIDRILPQGVVIDWKSGAYVPKTINNDVQFLLYYDVYTQLFDKEPAEVLGIFLLKNKVFKYKHNPLFRDIIFKEVIPSIVSAIKRNDFYREGMFRGDGICTHCSYKDICY